MTGTNTSATATPGYVPEMGSKTRIAVAAVVVMSVAVIGAWEAGYLGDGPQAGQVTRTTRSEAARIPEHIEHIEVSARDLSAAYRSNEVAADDKYRGKPLRVTGKIDRVERDFDGSPVVKITADGPWAVDCEFAGERGVLLALVAGEDVVATGYGGRFRITDPTLDQCDVAPSTTATPGISQARAAQAALLTSMSKPEEGYSFALGGENEVVISVTLNGQEACGAVMADYLKQDQLGSDLYKQGFRSVRCRADRWPHAITAKGFEHEDPRAIILRAEDSKCVGSGDDRRRCQEAGLDKMRSASMRLTMLGGDFVEVSTTPAETCKNLLTAHGLAENFAEAINFLGIHHTRCADGTAAIDVEPLR